MFHSPPNSTDNRTVAGCFAKALDADEFSAARELLSPECEYTCRDNVFNGPTAIIDSYREASEKARRLFDRVEYGSEIVESGPRHAVVSFWDRLEKDGQSHVFRSQQQLTLGADGRIVRIEHQDIPGEREALSAFMKQRGIEPAK